LDKELTAAAAAACAELGIPTTSISSTSDARNVDVVVGIGLPTSYRVLFDSSVRGVRVAWFGEPLPPADGSQRDIAFRAVPLGRVLDTVIWTTGRRKRRDPSDRLRHWREAAAYTYDWRRNLAAHAAAARAGIQVVVTSRDRSAALARRGL